MVYNRWTECCPFFCLGGNCHGRCLTAGQNAVLFFLWGGLSTEGYIGIHSNLVFIYVLLMRSKPNIQQYVIIFLIYIRKSVCRKVWGVLIAMTQVSHGRFVSNMGEALGDPYTELSDQEKTIAAMSSSNERIITVSGA